MSKFLHGPPTFSRGPSVGDRWFRLHCGPTVIPSHPDPPLHAILCRVRKQSVFAALFPSVSFTVGSFSIFLVWHPSLWSSPSLFPVPVAVSCAFSLGSVPDLGVLMAAG
jgi:hypothetical protein